MNIKQKHCLHSGEYRQCFCFMKRKEKELIDTLPKTSGRCILRPRPLYFSINAFRRKAKEYLIIK